MRIASPGYATGWKSASIGIVNETILFRANTSTRVCACVDGNFGEHEFSAKAFAARRKTSRANGRARRGTHSRRLRDIKSHGSVRAHTCGQLLRTKVSVSIGSIPLRYRTYAIWTAAWPVNDNEPCVRDGREQELEPTGFFGLGNAIRIFFFFLRFRFQFWFSKQF